MITFKFNLFPLSTNKLYVNIPGQKRRFVSTEGKKFKQEINDEVTNQSKIHNIALKLLEAKKLKVTIVVQSPSWVLKDGKTIAKKDIENTAKALIDSIFSSLTDSGLLLDDKQIWSLLLIKEIAPQDITFVTLEELE